MGNKICPMAFTKAIDTLTDDDNYTVCSGHITVSSLLYSQM